MVRDGRAKRQGHLDQGSWGGSNRGGEPEGTDNEPQTQGWEEWGEGPRGKGKGKGRAPNRCPRPPTLSMMGHQENEIGTWVRVERTDHPTCPPSLQDRMTNPNTLPGPPTLPQRDSPQMEGWREGEKDHRGREGEPNGPTSQSQGRGRGRGYRGIGRRPTQHPRPPIPGIMGYQESEIGTWDRVGRANHPICPPTPRDRMVHPNTLPGPPAPYQRNGPQVEGGEEWGEGPRGGEWEPNEPNRPTSQSRRWGRRKGYRGNGRRPTGHSRPPTHHHEYEIDQLVMDPDDNYAPEKHFDRLLPLSNRHPTNTDWHRWYGFLDRWTQSYARWTVKCTNGSQPPTTTAWKRRQQANGSRNPHLNPRPQNRVIGRKVAAQKEYRQNPKCYMAKLRKTPPPKKCSVHGNCHGILHSQTAPSRPNSTTRSLSYSSVAGHSSNRPP